MAFVAPGNSKPCISQYAEACRIYDLNLRVDTCKRSAVVQDVYKTSTFAKSGAGGDITPAPETQIYRHHFFMMTDLYVQRKRSLNLCLNGPEQ